jgi:hypothetical protein
MTDTRVVAPSTRGLAAEAAVGKGVSAYTQAGRYAFEHSICALISHENAASEARCLLMLALRQLVPTQVEQTVRDRALV